jgi:hypothetical protein
MNILKPLWVWNAIIFMFLFFHSGVYGEEIPVTGRVVPGDAQWNAITQADNAKNGIDVVLTSDAKIITGSKPFKLFARKLEAEPGSRIIAFESGANSGTNGRSSGANGSRGSDGKNAGNISFDVHRLFGYLYIDARGQAGGRGGDGVDGKQGAKGTDEVEDTEEYDCRCVEKKFDCNCRNEECNCERVCRWELLCLAGKTVCDTCRVCDTCTKKSCDTCSRPNNIPATYGGNGGAGGNAGPGGNGGNAGHVTLRVRDHYDAHLSVIYRGGQAGQAGQPGAGGEGGEPGKHKRLSKAQRGTKGRDGQYASSKGNQGKGGKVQIVSIAHLEEQRKAFHKEIQTLEDNLKKTRAEKDKLFSTLSEKYPLVRVWSENKSKRPYQFFEPDTHAGPNSEKKFRDLIAKLEQSDEPLSDNERNRLNKVRNDFLRLRMDNKIVAEIDNTIKIFEEQLTHHNKKLADALDWKNAKNWPLVGDNYEFKDMPIVVDNKLELSSY